MRERHLEGLDYERCTTPSLVLAPVRPAPPRLAPVSRRLPLELHQSPANEHSMQFAKVVDVVQRIRVQDHQVREAARQ